MLSVRNLCVSFRTEQGVVRAVDHVSFDVAEGEILGVVGESGSGKTVSLLSVIGLIIDPNAVIEGSIVYKGRELIGLPQRELRHVRGNEIAMIFQDPMTALTPVYTIGWQIAEQVMTHNKVSKSAARQRAVDLLAEVGFANPAAAVDRYPHELSGGMRQRAVIAMALSCNPSLLIADEPTTALDVTVQAQILDLVLRSRVAPWHPYTWGLLDSIPPLEGARPRRLKSIGGNPPSLLALPPGCAFAPRCRHRFHPCGERPELSGGNGHLAACFIPPAEREGARAGRIAAPAGAT